MSRLEVSEYGPLFDRAGFDCGIEPLNEYLKQRASQDIKRNISRIYVLHQKGERHVVGYYTLSSFSIDCGELPAAMARKLPRHPIPCALIGRLAVDRSLQGQGWGAILLVDALRRLLQVSEKLGIHLVVVDAKDAAAAAFYAKHGFESFPSRPLRLFIPMKTVATLK